MSRGQGTVDVDRLRSGLPRLAVSADVLEPMARWDDLDAYYRFYDLDLTLEFDGLAQTIGTIEAAGERLAVQVFRPAAPVASVQVCHGYYDHVGIYGHLVRYLVSRNLTVVAFDLPGHGLSTGPRATIDTFERYVEALAACRDATRPLAGNRRHIVAQSMGAAVTMDYLYTEPAADVAEVVLLAPLVRPAFWRVNRIVFSIARLIIAERPRALTRNAENPEFLALMRRDPLAPDVLPVPWVSALVAWMKRFERLGPLDRRVHVVQGHADRTVDWRYNLIAIDAHFETDVLTIEEARHHLVNESETIRARIWRWLDSVCRWC